ncbi:MAG TPA: oligosaccharide flippase family protein [Chloroflexota bacterium]|nr:oligosaccharide flippase family protein [Chloroflexota bacterium]
MKARLRIDGWPLLLLLAAALGFFWKVTLAGNVLLPVDNLYQYQPWASYAPAGFAGPHNPLISDSILENYGWKQVLLDAVHQRQLPLWNPYILGGTPFLAPGQASVLYPFVLLWLILPLAYAYGYFAALHLLFAGVGAYAFLRVSGRSRTAGVIAGLTYMFSTRLVTSILWPQMIGAIVWLPLLLLLVELIMRQSRAHWPLLPAIAGAVLLGISILAGHIEASVYVMAALALYGLSRVVAEEVVRRQPSGVDDEELSAVSYQLSGEQGRGCESSVFRLPAQTERGFLLRVVGSGVGLLVFGVGVAAVQLLPFYEVGSLNFRSGAVSYQDVVGFALKLPQLLTFLMPDFYGNPVIRSAPYWGSKDYVEQAAYIGVLPLLLGGFTLLALLRRKRIGIAGPRLQILVSLWIVIAISLLLAFGTPLYRVIFFLLPGFNQIHSPFRWLIPYTGAMALLAGFGFDLARERLGVARTVLSAVALAGGVGLAIWLRIVLPHVPAADQQLEIRNYIAFLALLIGAAAIAWTGRRAFGILAGVLVAADLGYFGIDFNTAADPHLLATTPRLVSFLQQDHDLFRVSAYGQDKMFEANGNVLYGLQDARGYDSVIIGRYAQLNGLLERQDQLQFNRVKTLDQPSALRSPLLNLLNVKYVVTTQELQDPRLEQVYAGPDGRVYRNRDVLPRAFVVSDVRVVPSAQAQLQLLSSPEFDVAKSAVVDKQLQPAAEATTGHAPASILSYTARKILLQASGPGLLVLTDNNFPGWKATIDGQPAEVLTADYTFRGVQLPAGQHEVEFNFAPTSLVVGGLLSALSLALIALALAAYAWRSYARRTSLVPAHTARRVTKNSLAPLASNLATKLLSFGFSVYYFRALGLTQVGKYVLATTVWLFLDTIIGFGLQQFVMREVARDKTQANAYINNAAGVRLAVTLMVGLPVTLGVWALHRYAGFDADTAVVIAILIAGFIPGAFSNVFSHVFDAHELMEYKAFVQVLTQVVNIALGAAFVLAGWDIVGLAVAALLTNVVTAAVFWALTSRTIVRPAWALDGRLIRGIFRGAYPIMLNQLLTVFFFKIDVPVLRAFRGNDEVGIYGAAYKFVDAMLLIPSTFVPAVFPILSRQAASQREALWRGTDLSLKVLLLVSLPVLAGFEVFADDIVRGFYGQKFAASVLALRILMLFLPFSYVNGLTQYVLIALDKQKTIVRFFAITAVFNLAVNVALVPFFGYVAASVVTVGSEVVLLIPLWWLTARELRGASLLRVAARPAAAALAAGLAMLALRPPASLALGVSLGPIVAAIAGAVVYVLALLALRTFSDEERALLKGLIRRRPLAPAAAVGTPTSVA